MPVFLLIMFWYTCAQAQVYQSIWFGILEPTVQIFSGLSRNCSRCPEKVGGYFWMIQYVSTNLKQYGNFENLHADAQKNDSPLSINSIT